jgi:hypothetical protein
MTKIQLIIEGLKIFDKYDCEICAQDDRILIYSEIPIDMSDQKVLISKLDWEMGEDNRQWSIFV